MSKGIVLTNPSEKANGSFESIKKCITGLFEVLRVNLDETDIYYEVGIENLTGLYKHLLELLINEKGLKKFTQKIRDKKIELDIPLDIK